MIEFICDSCHKTKKRDQSWILGLAAESIGAKSATREISVLSKWANAEAVHPMAVHFCSERCKDRYMKKLFTYELAS